MIHIKGSNKTFKVNKQNNFLALNHINLSIKNAGLYVIKGESGSGKTTLLNCIAGIDTFDENINNNKIPKGEVSFIFQDFNLIENMTIEENLTFILEINKLNQKDKMYQLMKDLNIYDWKAHMPHQISGGQKQRVAIARALLTDKPIIIADEPTGNLDNQNAQEIAHLLKQISKDKIVIVATHDMSIFENIADSIFEINKGKLSTIKHHSTSSIVNTYTKITEHMTYKHLFRFAIKGYRSKYSKLIIMFLTLGLSMLFALSAVNLMINNPYKIKTDYFEEHQLKYVELVGYEDINEHIDTHGLTNDQIHDLLEDYEIDNHMIFYDLVRSNIEYDQNNVDIESYRIYQTSSIDYETINQNNNLLINQVIISDAIAEELLKTSQHVDMKDLIGKTLSINDNQLTIADIALLSSEIPQSNTYTILEQQEQQKFLNSIFINEETFIQLSYKTARDKINIHLNDIEETIAITDLDHAFHTDIAYGSSNLTNDGVVISDQMAQILAEDGISDLIGKEINIDINRFVYGLSESVSSTTYTFTIQGIFTPGFEEIPWMFSDATYKELSYHFGLNNYHTSTLQGVAFSGYSKEMLKQLDESNIMDYSYLSQHFNNANEYVESMLGLIFLGAAILLVIAIFVVISFMNTSILERKNEIGLLLSFNIKLKEINKIIWIEISMIVMLIIFICSIIEIFLIHMFNQLLKNTLSISFNYIYYHIGSIAIISVILFLMIYVFAKISMRKLNKKNTVELIRFV